MQKNKDIWRIFVQNVFWGILAGDIAFFDSPRLDPYPGWPIVLSVHCVFYIVPVCHHALVVEAGPNTSHRPAADISFNTRLDVDDDDGRCQRRGRRIADLTRRRLVTDRLKLMPSLTRHVL